MEEVSVAVSAGVAGQWTCQPAYIESGEGFGPFVDEKGNSVATPGHQRSSERAPPRGGAAGCEQDPWAGAEAPAPSWTGATRSDLDVGQEGVWFLSDGFGKY